MRRTALVAGLLALAACAVPVKSPHVGPMTGTPVPTSTTSPTPANPTPAATPTAAPPSPQVLASATAPPVPEADPAPLPLATNLPIELLSREVSAAPVGGAIDLAYRSPEYQDRGVPAGQAWQLLDPAMGTIEGGTRVRVAKPGPIYAYLERKGARGDARFYVLLAGLDGGFRALPSAEADATVPWATFLRTEDDWNAYWVAAGIRGAWPEPPVDFVADDVLAVRRGSGGDPLFAAQVTGVDAAGTADLVLTDLSDAHGSPAAVFGRLDLIALPKAAKARALRVHALKPNTYVPLTGPTGPRPALQPNGR